MYSVSFNGPRVKTVCNICEVTRYLLDKVENPCRYSDRITLIFHNDICRIIITVSKIPDKNNLYTKRAFLLQDTHQ